jgi:hypothetical protein
MQEYVEKLIAELDSSQSVTKIEVHSFDSGAYMIDVWVDESFYCLQLYDQKFGYSKIEGDIDFSTIPDHLFDTFNEFTSYLLEEINRRDR